MQGMRLIGMMLDLTVNAWVVEVGSHAPFFVESHVIFVSFEEEGFS